MDNKSLIQAGDTVFLDYVLAGRLNHVGVLLDDYDSWMALEGA